MAKYSAEFFKQTILLCSLKTYGKEWGSRGEKSFTIEEYTLLNSSSIYIISNALSSWKTYREESRD